MHVKRALQYGGYYLVLSVVASVVGFALVGVGFVLGLGSAYELLQSGAPLGSVLTSAAPGLVAAALGLLVWLLGTLAAFFKTVSEAVDHEMRDRFDSEKVKSEILSVLDDRLSDVEHDVEHVRRNVAEMTRDDDASEFEFGGE